MSTHASHVPLSAPSGWGVGSLLRFARRVHERRQAAATFAKLDDRLLRDIGLTRADAMRRGRGPGLPAGLSVRQPRSDHSPPPRLWT